MEKRLVQWLSAVIAALLLLIGVSFASTPHTFTSPGGYEIVPEERMDVYVLDVGQGDSSLIQTPNNITVLIDGGPDNTVLPALGEYLPFHQRYIDYVILTHPHADHVTGLVEVLRRYKVGKVIMTGVAHSSADYRAFLTEIQEQNIPVMIIEKPEHLQLGDVVLEFVAPLESYAGVENVHNLNNTSIITRVVYDDVAFLFPGDAEKEEELEVVSSGQELQAQVLKLGHHGSSTSSTKIFLDAVQPEVGIVSAGIDNDFGHPHERILSRMKQYGISVARTDFDGDIHLVTDGKEYFLINH